MNDKQYENVARQLKTFEDCKIENVVHSHSMYYMTLDGIKVWFQKNKPVWIEMNSTIANILICEGVIGLGILISNILFSDLILNLMFSLTSPILTGLFRNITNAKVKTFATHVLSRKKTKVWSVFAKGALLVIWIGFSLVSWWIESIWQNQLPSFTKCVKRINFWLTMCRQSSSVSIDHHQNQPSS